MINSTFFFNFLFNLLRGAVWLGYGPYSVVIVILLLYGIVEFGLNFFATSIPRERRLYAGLISSSAIGIAVWLTRSHIPPILLLLLGVSAAYTWVAFFLAVKRGSRRKRSRTVAATSLAPEETK